MTPSSFGVSVSYGDSGQPLVIDIVVGLACRQPQHPGKSTSEVVVAEWIEDRIERRVEVAKPDGGSVGVGGNTGVTECHDREECEVWHPAGHEGSHYDPQLPRCLTLLYQVDAFHTPATTTTTTTVGTGHGSLLPGAICGSRGCGPWAACALQLGAATNAPTAAPLLLLGSVWG